MKFPNGGRVTRTGPTTGGEKKKNHGGKEPVGRERGGNGGNRGVFTLAEWGTGLKGRGSPEVGEGQVQKPGRVRPGKSILSPSPYFFTAVILHLGLRAKGGRVKKGPNYCSQ